jgi:hypothetical protein
MARGRHTAQPLFDDPVRLVTLALYEQGGSCGQIKPASAMMSTRVLSAKFVPVSLKKERPLQNAYTVFPNSSLAPSLVGFARNSDHTSGRGALVHLHLKLLRLFLHPNPSKLADKTESFRRRRSILPIDGDFSTL